MMHSYRWMAGLTPSEVEAKGYHVNPGDGTVRDEWGRVQTDSKGNAFRVDGPTVTSEPKPNDNKR